LLITTRINNYKDNFKIEGETVIASTLSSFKNELLILLTV